MCVRICIVLLCLFSLAATGIADDSLVLYFTFDEGSGDDVIDVSDYINNGVLVGDPEWVAGKFGTALAFDGVGDSVEIPSSDSLNATDGITMSMWVKAPAGGGIKQAGIEKGGWEVGEYSIYPVYEGGTVIQFFDLPPACGDAGVRGPSLQDDQWHYFVGTWDGELISLYIDGKLASSGACDGSLMESAGAVHIGSRLAAGDRFLTGAVDEVRIYNRGLSEAEINEDMETFGGLAVFPSRNLATCWGGLKRP